MPDSGKNCQVLIFHSFSFIPGGSNHFFLYTENTGKLFGFMGHVAAAMKRMYTNYANCHRLEGNIL